MHARLVEWFSGELPHGHPPSHAEPRAPGCLAPPEFLVTRAMSQASNCGRTRVDVVRVVNITAVLGPSVLMPPQGRLHRLSRPGPSGTARASRARGRLEQLAGPRRPLRALLRRRRAARQSRRGQFPGIARLTVLESLSPG